MTWAASCSYGTGNSTGPGSRARHRRRRRGWPLLRAPLRPGLFAPSQRGVGQVRGTRLAPRPPRSRYLSERHLWNAVHGYLDLLPLGPERPDTGRAARPAAEECVFSQESRALLIRAPWILTVGPDEALHLIASLTFRGFGKSKPLGGSSSGRWSTHRGELNASATGPEVPSGSSPHASCRHPPAHRAS